MQTAEKPKTTPIATPCVVATVVDSEIGLCDLFEEWDALFADCERPSLCARPEWALSWWQTFGKAAVVGKAGLFVVVLRDRMGRLVGLAPMYEETHSRLSPRARRLRLIGHFGGDKDCDMTEEPTLLIRDGWETRGLEALAAILRVHLERRRWDFVFLRCLREGPTDFLESALSPLRQGAWFRTEVRPGSLTADLPETWAEYRKILTRSMRDNLGYYPRLLTRDGHDWSIRMVREPAAMAEAVERLADLHVARSQSDRGVGHTNYLQGDVQRTFLAEMLERLARHDKAFVAELVVGERVVASQAFVEDGDQLMVYYSGYDEAWYKYSPIFVIDARVMQEAMERGVRHVNFLLQTALWKTRWGAAEGAGCHRAFIVPNSAASYAKFGLYCARIAYAKLSENRWERVRTRLKTLKSRAPKAVLAE